VGDERRRRSAYQRIAHLLCETRLRLQAVGRADGPDIVFPITQAEIADATGLSNVHVNRVLQELRSDGLVVWVGEKVTVPNWERLKQAGTFSPDYLFFSKAGLQNAKSLLHPLPR
jgi:CRP-like cAMP-binding protein